MKHQNYLFLPLLLLTAALYLSVPPAAAQAPDDGVVCERRDGDITILPDGSFQVVETWTVRFSEGPFTTLSHNFVVGRFSALHDWSLREGTQDYQEGEGSAPSTFNVRQEEEHIILTWFFSPASDETRTFTLRYTVDGALLIYDDGDQFRWPFVEWDRLFPIEAAHAVVHLPQPFTPEQLHVATKQFPEVTATYEVVDGQTVAFSAQPFRRGIEWELQITFPHESVTATAQPWQVAEDHRLAEEATRQAMRDAQQQTRNNMSIVLALIILVADLGAIGWVWYRFVRNKPAPRAHDQEPVQAISERIPPGLANALIKGRIDSEDIAAMIIDLARRGYLRIVESRQDDGTRTFTFERLSADEGMLAPYEQTLLHGIFAHGTSHRIQAPDSSIYRSVVQLKDELCHQVVTEGYCTQNPARLRRTALLVGFGILVAAFFIGSFVASVGVSHNAPIAFLVPIATMPLGIGLALIHTSMHTRTAKGAAEVAHLRAFRSYLGHRTQQDNVAEHRDDFECYLAFAVAFKQESSWFAAFAAVNAPVPAWYALEGSNPPYRLHTMREGFPELLRQIEQACTSFASADL